MGELVGVVLRENELVTLDLRFCKLNTAGTAFIIEALKDNKSIKELILSGNNTDKKINANVR